MSLQAIGPRVVVSPIVPNASDVIELTDRKFQQMGRVVSVGRAFCPECNAVASIDVQIGDVVLFHTSVGQEITSNHGHNLIVIGFQDVLAVYEPDTKRATA